MWISCFNCLYFGALLLNFCEYFLQALAEAIRSVTEMDPDLSVEKIEIKTESEAQ